MKHKISNNMMRLATIKHRYQSDARLRALRDGDVPAPLLMVVVPLFLLIASTPLFVSRFPPLGDYPNHLARIYILAEYAKIPQFHTVYDINWNIVPDLAMDILVPPIAGVVGIEAAGRVFIFAIFLVTVAGALLVNKALYGRVSIGALFVFCILYNGILDWGLMNYLFGIGVSMIGFGIYVMYRQKGELFRIIVSSLMSIVIFLCHLYAFAIYGILVIFYELSNSFENKTYKRLRHLLSDLTLAGIQAVVPVTILFFFSSTIHSVRDISEGGVETFDYGNMRRRLEGLSYMFGNYNTGIDLICYISIAVLVGYLLGRRGISMSRPALAALVFLCALYPVMPAVIFGVSSADRRLIVAIALVAVSAVRVSTRSWRELAAVGTVLVWVFALQVAIAGRSWMAYEGRLANYLTAFEQVEKGSNVALAIDPDASWFPINVRHVASLVVLQRQAFAPNIFATRGHQSITLTEKYQRIARAAPRSELYNRLLAISEDGSREELDSTVKGSLAPFEYLLVIHESQTAPRLARLGLQRIAFASDFDLYHLR